VAVAPVNLTLVPDTFGPTLVGSNLPEGAVVGRSFRAVTLTFSEAISEKAFGNGTVQLVDANGTAIDAQNVQFRQGDKQVQVTFAQQAVGNYTLRINTAQVKDRVGNAMGTGAADTHFTIKQFSVEWIAPTGGNWNTAANWSTGVVPIATDDVFIPVLSSPVVISSGAVTIQSLISNGSVTLSGGTLTINGDSQINGSGSRWTGAGC
jgi:methionine-rich copper-binding protein CopC